MPSRRNSTPANGLYMLARFASLTCDHIWLEDFVINATDAIEDVVVVSTLRLCIVSEVSNASNSRTIRTI